MDVNTASVMGIFQQAAAMTAKSLFAESLTDVRGILDGASISERINSRMQFVRDNMDDGIVAALDAMPSGDDDVDYMFAPS